VGLKKHIEEKTYHLKKKTEITERCWKGYTQKGMKTMFGKKYPNCVKIKKKTVKENSEDESQASQSPLKNKIKRSIEKNGFWETIKFLGGIKNLKKIFNNDPDLEKIFDLLKGTMNLVYHSRNEFIEFPFKFEIVEIAKNSWETNTWPVVNLIYNDPGFLEEEKEMFDQFLYHTIADLNIDKVEINPRIRYMYQDGNYVSIDFVNGKHWESLDHEIIYNDKDIKHLHRLYLENNKPNESIRLFENENDSKSNLPASFKRRLDIHKFEKMLLKGSSYVYYDSNSLDEFKHKLIQATLENYLFYKYQNELEEFPESEIQNAVTYLINVFNPLLIAYYRNLKRNTTPKRSPKNKLTENSFDPIFKLLKKKWDSEIKKGIYPKIDRFQLGKLGLEKKIKPINDYYIEYMGGIDSLKDKFINYLKSKTFTTEDIMNVGVQTGGYDIVFKLQNVRYIENSIHGFKPTLYVDLELIMGTVTLITTGEEYDLMDHDSISDELWWELDIEIKDMITEFLWVKLEYFGLGFGLLYEDYDGIDINVSWY